MNTTKKLLALCLAIAMLFTLAACNDSESVSGTITINTTTAGGTTTTEAATTTTEAVTTGTTVADVTDVPAFDIGSSTGGTYENDFLGIGCKLDSGFTFLSDEEIRQLNEATGEVMGEDYANAMANAQVVYDMQATNMTTGTTVNVNIENLGLLYGSVLSESDYIDIGIDGLKTAFAEAGMDVGEPEKITTTLAGKEHTAIALELDMGGVVIYEIVVAVKAGDYMGVVTFASQEPEELGVLIDSFYAV